MEWPRKYLSWSQFSCWQNSGQTHYEYFRRYLYNEPLPTTPAMQLGSRMAEMLDRRDQATGDTMLEHYRTFLPRYEHREEEIRETYGLVPLLAKPDGFDFGCPTCGSWTGMVDLNHAKQQRQVHEGPRSASHMEMEHWPQNARSAENSLEQSSKGTAQFSSDAVQKGPTSVEQGSEVLRSDSSQYEHLENGHKVAAVHKRTSGQDRPSKLARDDQRAGEDQKTNRVRGMAHEGVQEGQLDVPGLRRAGSSHRSGSHQAVRTISEVTSQGEQRANALQTLPQKTPCETCHDKPYIALGEYKTSKLWTQERADLHEQIDFYDLVFWKKYGVIPLNTIHWIPTYTEPETGRILPTGDWKDFPTLRTDAQLIKFGARLMMVWNEIGRLYAAKKQSIMP